MTLWAVHVVTYNQGKMILIRKELGAQLTFTGISVLLLQNWLLIMLCSIYYCYACFYTSHVYMYIEISISFLCLLSFMKVDSLFSCNQAALWMVHSVCLSLCPSVRLSVCLARLFHYVPIIISSWNLITMTHCHDVIMSVIASQITSLPIVYSIVYSGADQIKNQSSASLAFVWGIHPWPVNSPHKWPVTWKMFPFDDTIMRSDVHAKGHGHRGQNPT